MFLEVKVDTILLYMAKAFQIPKYQNLHVNGKALQFHIISIQQNKYETLHSISLVNLQTSFQDVDKHSPFEKMLYFVLNEFLFSVQLGFKESKVLSCL